ncbi:Clavaminate synthase-like protein [Neoconidiobolus thromboides FSU 785]|nr:Clavaminate synthase-like protein [Neoconidiobolus thromboides FSU 785]
MDPKLDKLKRIDYISTSREEFIEKYEKLNIPVIIKGLTDLWPAKNKWNEEYFTQVYANEKFRVGHDDKNNGVYIKMKHYFSYLKTEGITDDSPLYVFDSSVTRKKDLKKKKNNNNNKRKINGEDKDIVKKENLLNDFFIPKFFDIDLFHLTGNRRPPYRWIVIGAARSGTDIHIDPLGTSAWNALIKGYKRWVLFPPNTDKNLIDPSNGRKDREAINWFSDEFMDPVLDPTLGKILKMQQVLQRPGETIFVPGGWSHIVINVDFTIAITQNFCSPTNLEYVYLKTRYARPKLALKLIHSLDTLAKLSQSKRMKLPPPYGDYDGNFYYKLASSIRKLQTIPRLYSSDSGNSSSSSEEESEGENEDEMRIVKAIKKAE